MNLKFDYNNMMKDANINAVRFHAQPYPSFYLDLADEMGICVLDESAIWASGGGPKYDSEEYWKRADDHIRRLVARDRKRDDGGRDPALCVHCAQRVSQRQKQETTCV